MKSARRVLAACFGASLLVSSLLLALQRRHESAKLLLIDRYRDGWFGMEPVTKQTFRYTQPRDREFPTIVDDWLYFIRASSLYRLHLPTRQTEWLLDQTDFGDFSTPKNDMLVYFRRATSVELHRLDLKSKATQNITPPNANLLDWSLVGNRFIITENKVVFIGRDFALYQMEGDDIRKIGQVFEVGASVQYIVALNAVVGEWLLYTHGDRIYRISLAGGEPFRFYDSIGSQELINWNDDSVWIRYSAVSNVAEGVAADYVAAFQVDTLTPAPIWAIAVNTVNPVLTPNGKWVLFTRFTTNGSDIFRMTPQGEAETRLTDFVGIKNFVTGDWAGDNFMFFTVQRGTRQSLYRMDYNGGQVRQLFEGRGSEIRQVQWSAEWVYFVIGQRGNTVAYQVRHDGRDLAQIGTRVEILGWVPMFSTAWRSAWLVLAGLGWMAFGLWRR